MIDEELYNDRLHEALSQLPLEQPGEDFDLRVMDAVNLHVRKQSSLKVFGGYLAISASGVFLLGLTAILFHYLEIDPVKLKGLLAGIEMPSLSISSSSIWLAIVAVLLLLINLYVQHRKFLHSGK